MTAAPLEIELRDIAGTVVVIPSGELDAVGYARLRDTLLKAGVDEPRAVVVDIERLSMPDTAAALFTHVSEQLGRWPGVPLLVAAAGRGQPAMLARSGLHGSCPCTGASGDAVAAIGLPPPRRIVRHTLSNGYGAAREARRFTREVCAQWGASAARRPRSPSRTGSSRTRSCTRTAPPSMRLELRRGLLTVAVYDDDPAHPRLAGPDDPPGTRLGLRIVANLAAVWGSSPTASGGKVVWAVVRVRPRPTGG